MVPLISQQNGQNQFTDITIDSGGVVHSGGTLDLGIGVVDNTGQNTTLLDELAETKVLRLLNTSVNDPLYVWGQ
jgi:adhesin HecA-like repeat protein